MPNPPLPERWPPDWLNELARLVDAQHPDDREAAISYLLERAQNHAEYGSAIMHLVRFALRHLIYKVRTELNKRIKRDEDVDYFREGKNAAPNAPNANYGEASNRIYHSYYEYRIGGKILGELIIGEDTRAVIARAQGVIIGSQFHIELMEWIEKTGTDGKKVRDCISQIKLRKFFRKNWELYHGAQPEKVVTAS